MSEVHNRWGAENSQRAKYRSSLKSGMCMGGSLANGAFGSLQVERLAEPVAPGEVEADGHRRLLRQRAERDENRRVLLHHLVVATRAGDEQGGAGLLSGRVDVVQVRQAVLR